ncbi:MAG: hypothetical protein DCC57_06600 [Chloroflexi bacterium]|nr:MAG: hypothetical protein DCC57_06600 [Chloroflexota bacterium]
MTLAALALLYVAVFGRLALAQHAGMRTHKADLGQIAQAVWNSSRGRFVEMTDNGFIATRMTDHVEPILALISPVLWLWEDVRALLLLQVAAVAAGAWLLYALALRLLDDTLPPAARGQIWQWEPLRQLTRPLALALAAAYLLTPQLQSAVLTEFHAAPLAVPLILWALWAVEARRWGQAAAAVILVAAVKEEMALLAAGLGVWVAWRGAGVQRRGLGPALLGGGLALASLAWFYVATFVIVPAHAVQVYGVAESGYFRRYGALGDSPLDIARSFWTRPRLVWAVATEPARLAYLRGLLAPYGFLSLLAPELLLISAPVLLANLLSAYPAQYYGDFHYSAPVVVYFAAAAALGLARLWRVTAARLNRTSSSFQHLPAASSLTMAAAALARNSATALRPLAALAIGLWIAGWAVGSYAAAGRGPGGAAYDPPPVDAHHRLLARFTAQLPRDAAVTATAAVHPHVSLRRFVYQFPIGLEPPGVAEWALLDVTTATDMAPGDVRTQVEAMLAGGWGVVDAADGFLLLRKGAAAKVIPEAFYSFARRPGPVEGESPLRLAAVAASDWPRWRQTQVTSEWQVGRGFDPASMAPQVTLRDPAGNLLHRFADATPPALVWLPPAAWQPGDRIRITTLPLYLPRAWGVVVEATPGLAQPVAGALAGNAQAALAALYGRDRTGDLLRLDGLIGQRDWGVRLGAALGVPLTTARAEFATPEGRLAATAWLPQTPLWPGAPLDLWLDWQTAAWPDGVAAFVHLRREGENQDQQDGAPRLVVDDTTPANFVDRGHLPDWRQLRVPETAQTGQPGAWPVVIGLYDPATGARVPQADGSGDELVVGTVEIGTPPVPDQACALIAAACAAQP